ncbi:MAG: helicase RepA family protein [Acidobacteria bacterium]|nr:helicase RepA family protein [Acidobacteriota bacterium]
MTDDKTGPKDFTESGTSPPNPAGIHRSRPDATAAHHPTVVPRKRERFHLYSVDELLQLPPADWLIEGVIEQPSVGFLFGPSGEGKTFVTLDWSLSVAAGRAWQGRAVKQGAVVYVVAEGSSGIPKRVTAWLQHNAESGVDGAFFVLDAVQLRTAGDVGGLLQQIKDTCDTPALIVLDTFAQCFVGGEENSAKEVGEAIAAARRLSEKTGASVLLVHHSGRANVGNERGSSALRGNADVMIAVSMTADRAVTIRNTKQKDHEHFGDIKLTLQQVSLVNADGMTSCVLVPRSRGECATGPAVQRSRATMNESQRRALAVLAAAEGDLSAGDWRKAIGLAQDCDVSTSTFANWRTDLQKLELVEEVPEKTHHYRLTEAGRAIRDGRPQ